MTLWYAIVIESRENLIYFVKSLRSSTLILYIQSYIENVSMIVHYFSIDVTFQYTYHKQSIKFNWMLQEITFLSSFWCYVFKNIPTITFTKKCIHLDFCPHNMIVTTFFLAHHCKIEYTQSWCRKKMDPINLGSFY